MNHEEAIKVIKSNYPPDNYTMLREALDLAIEELSKAVEIEGFTVTTDDNEVVASISFVDGQGIVKNGYKVSGYDKA